MMKKLMLSLFVALMGSFCYAQNGLECVIVEEVDAGTAGPGLISYRVFVDLEPGFELQQLYGNSDDPLNISTTTTWFNDAAGASNGELMNAAFFLPPFDFVFPTFPFDSYISLGGASQTEWGVLNSDAPGGRLALGPVNAVSLLGGINVDENFGAAASTNSLVANEDGQYFTLTSNGDIAPDNRIYVGQFTTDGEFSFAINIQTRVIGTNDFFVINAAEAPCLNYPMAPPPPGCTDPLACNFDPLAGEDDDSCFFATSCDDGDACTTDSEDQCDPLDCTNTAIDCDDGDACTADSCDSETGCVNTTIDCDDGDACTTDSCDSAIGCVNTAIDCDDGDACTTDSCDSTTGCVNTAVDCDDNDACTTDSCDSTTGCVNTAIDCDDGDATTNDSCVNGTCINTPIGCVDDTSCDDEDACTTDICDAGVCVYSPIDCDDGDACTADACDPSDGCINTAIDCNDDDACTIDSCDSETGCVNTPINCDDNDPATTDSCVEGDCENVIITCDDNDACTTDTMNDGGECVFTDVDCDDGDACTTDSCDSETGCVYTDVNCDDEDACTIDSCDSETGCVNTPIDCDDNDPDTSDSCVDGECVNTTIGDCENVDPSMWGMGPWFPISQGIFVAESANDAVLAKGTGDLSVEIFEGECGELSIGSYNTVDEGIIERIVVGDLVAGQTYSYTISGGTNIMSKVKTYADSRLEDFDCNVEQALIDQIYALREETMYSNPAVQVTGFAFRFEDVNTEEVIELIDATVDGFYQQLVTIPQIQDGHTYSVTVKHRVIQIANATVSNLWSDYGSACTITVNDGDDFANDDDVDAANNTINLPLEVTIYPNPNNGDQVYLDFVNFNEIDSDVIVSIIDMYGKQIHMEQFTSSANDSKRVITFDQDLSAGMYFINLTVNDRVLTQKLVVQ
ncbi:MAG: hypothetical protein ACI81Y_001454 [Glaciecola sp.]|jgi:hypothetical protein